MDMSFPGYRVSLLLWILLSLWINAAVASMAEVSPAAGASNQAEMHIEGQTISLRLEMGQNDFDKLAALAKKQQQGLETLLAEVIQIEVGGENIKPVAIRYLGNQAGRLLAPDSAEMTAMWTDNFAARPGLTASGSTKQVTRPVMSHAVETIFSIPGDSNDSPLKLIPLIDTTTNNPSPFAIGLIVYHEQIPVTEHRLLSQAETLMLNKQDPWLSRFENPAMNRMLQSVITGILYVEPTEIRQELIIRLGDLLAWLELSKTKEAKIITAAIENQRVMPPHRQHTPKELISELLMTHNALSIEGKPQQVIFDRIEYLTPGPHGLVTASQDGQLDIQTTFIGIVFAYTIPHYPSEITLHWSIFPPGVKIIPVTTFDLTGQFDSYVTPADPSFKWEDMIDEYDFLENHAALKEARKALLDNVQVLARNDQRVTDSLIAGSIAVMLVLGFIFLTGKLRKKQMSTNLAWGSGIALLLLVSILVLQEQGYEFTGDMPEEELDEMRAKQIVTQLLKNIYRSFDFRAEHDAYDKLASSAHGNLLETLYLQNRQAQLRAQAGGTRTKVQHVEVTNTRIDRVEPNSMVYHIDAHWIIQGSVAHWGHVHQRQNRYQARLAIEPADGLWKLTQFDLMDEQRVNQQRALP